MSSRSAAAASSRSRSPTSTAASARMQSPASTAASKCSRSQARERSRSPARRPPGDRSPARRRDAHHLWIGSKAASRTAAQVWGLCTSHDFSFRPSDARLLRRGFAEIRAQSPELFWTYFLSSFSYSLIGAAMLLHFELPAVFRDAAPLPVEAFAGLLVVQGPLSFAADVWARALRGLPRHGWCDSHHTHAAALCAVPTEAATLRHPLRERLLPCVCGRARP